MSATYQIRRSDAGHIIHAGVEFANLGEFMAAKFGGTASDYGYTTTLKPTIESETIMAKLTDAELIATGDAGKIAERAESLSSGYTVRTQGKRAAALYRAAATIEREQGGYTLTHRASWHDELAAWCEQQVTP